MYGTTQTAEYVRSVPFYSELTALHTFALFRPSAGKEYQRLEAPSVACLIARHTIRRTGKLSHKLGVSFSLAFHVVYDR